MYFRYKNMNTDRTSFTKKSVALVSFIRDSIYRDRILNKSMKQIPQMCIILCCCVSG